MAANNKQRVTLFLNPALLTHAKAQALLEDKTLTELVQAALIEYLPSKIVIEKPQLKVS